MTKEALDKVGQKLLVVCVLCIIAVALPVIFPYVFLLFLRNVVANIFINTLLKIKSKRFVLYKGKDPILRSLVDEHVLPHIADRGFVFPDSRSFSILRTLFLRDLFAREPNILVAEGMFRNRSIPLQRSLAKFKKGNRSRLKNILFKVNTMSLEENVQGDLREGASDVHAFKKELIQELIIMAENQEAESTATYVIPLEEYEEDFRYFNDKDLYLIRHFIECWNDEAAHGFPGFHFELRKTDWSKIARSISQSIETQSPFAENIQTRFGFRKIKTNASTIRDFLWMLVVIVVVGLMTFQCTKNRTLSVCHQINMKDCVR